MTNIAAVLKGEIARLARKEIRTQTSALQKSCSDQRKRITELTKQLASAQAAIKRLERASGTKSKALQSLPSPAGTVGELRWRPDGFAKLRARLGLSAQQMAQLLGCSALSVYKWESGKVRPRRAQLEAIARVRSLSKSEAMSQLGVAEQA